MRNLVQRAIDLVRMAEPPASHDELTLSEAQVQAHKSPEPGPIEQLFYGHSGRWMTKWPHYLPVYDRVLAPYRGKPVTMLEIGVARGGSLQMWREYFGPSATIYGVDINPASASLVDPPSQVRIGSQADPEFLRKVVAELGAPDIVLDDGSHVAAHQRVSFETLWPLLKTGGLYIIEDLHTAYYHWMEGGYRRPGTGIELVKSLIDDMHGWHHGRGSRFAPREEIGAVLAFDSIVVIEKVQRPRPGHLHVGGEANPADAAQGSAT